MVCHVREALRGLRGPRSRGQKGDAELQYGLSKTSPRPPLNIIWSSNMSYSQNSLNGGGSVEECSLGY